MGKQFRFQVLKIIFNFTTWAEIYNAGMGAVWVPAPETRTKNSKSGTRPGKFSNPEPRFPGPFRNSSEFFSIEIFFKLNIEIPGFRPGTRNSEQKTIPAWNPEFKSFGPGVQKIVV